MNGKNYTTIRKGKISFNHINRVRARVARVVRRSAAVAFCTRRELGDFLASGGRVDEQLGAFMRTSPDSWVLSYGEGRFRLEGGSPKVFSEADIVRRVTGRYIPTREIWADTAVCFDSAGHMLLKKPNEYATAELYHYYGWQR